MLLLILKLHYFLFTIKSLKRQLWRRGLNGFGLPIKGHLSRHSRLSGLFSLFGFFGLFG